MAGKNKDASLNKRAFTSGFFFILAQLFARGLTFAVTPVYSRLLTKAQYGVVRTYESWLLIAYTIMSLCLWRSVDVAKKDFEDDYNGFKIHKDDFNTFAKKIYNILFDSDNESLRKNAIETVKQSFSSNYINKSFNS